MIYLPYLTRSLSAQEIICLLKLISVESPERNSGWRELRRRRNAFRENVLRNIRAEASGTAGPRLVLDHPRMQVLGLPVERWTRVASPPLTEREDGDDWVARCTATALREQVLGEFEFKNILYLCHFMKVLGSADNFTERYFCSGACTAGKRQSIVQFVHTLVLQSARSCTLAPEGFPFPDPTITSTGLCAGLFGPIPANPEANRSPRSARRAVRPVSAGRGRPSPPVSRLLRSKFEFDEKKHDGPLNGSLADRGMSGVAAPPSVSLQFYLRGGGGRCDRSLPQRIDATDSSLKLSERFFGDILNDEAENSGLGRRVLFLLDTSTSASDLDGRWLPFLRESCCEYLHLQTQIEFINIIRFSSEGIFSLFAGLRDIRSQKEELSRVISWCEGLEALAEEEIHSSVLLDAVFKYALEVGAGADTVVLFVSPGAPWDPTETYAGSAFKDVMSTFQKRNSRNTPVPIHVICFDAKEDHPLWEIPRKAGGQGRNLTLLESEDGECANAVKTSENGSLGFGLPSRSKAPWEILVETVFQKVA